MSAKTTRMLLVRAMLKLVRTQKFSSITVDDICEKSEVSRRTFYRYYSDKHALLKDVYVQCFFSKIQIDEDMDPWDIVQAICEQVYTDKKFFTHSFEVKGQNGFWEEVQNILLPHFMRGLPSYEGADNMRDFFTSTDITRILTLIEEWIREGMQISPKEFASALRTSYIVYSTWMYDVASGKPITQFSDEIFEKVKILKK